MKSHTKRNKYINLKKKSKRLFAFLFMLMHFKIIYIGKLFKKNVKPR